MKPLSNQCGTRSTTAELVCIEGMCPPRLDKSTAPDLDILKLEKALAIDDKSAALGPKFPAITNVIGKLHCAGVELHVDSSVPRVARKLVRVHSTLETK